MQKQMILFKYSNSGKAYILKSTMDEFADIPVKQIAEELIEGSPLVSETAVFQDTPDKDGKMNGSSRVQEMATEDVSVLEGTVRYDIRFVVRVPGINERIEIIVNIEIQNNDKPGYPIPKRGIYYGARMVSSQRGTLFRDQEYGKIKKVVSIWICENTAVSRSDSINEYSFDDPAVIGSSSSSMTVKRELNEYLTSIYYNDTVLEQIYNLVSSRDDFRGFVYLSDHAEEVTPPSGRHNMGQFTYTMTRIPLIINLDEKYVEDYSQSFNTLEHNKDKLFINDALYDLMLPLMQVKTEAFNKALALSEPSYLEGIERGAIVEPKNVLEDPILIGAKNLKAFSSRVIIADPSCVFDAGLSMLYGAEAFKLDAVIEDDTLQVVLKGDDRKLSFEKFISSLPQEPKRVFLQVKLDEGQDKSVALKIVDELSKKYFKTQFWVNFAGSDLVENVGVNAVSSVRYQLVDCKSYSDFALSQPISEGGQRLIGVNCELGLQKTKLSKFFEQHPKLEWVLSEFVTDFDERK